MSNLIHTPPSPRQSCPFDVIAISPVSSSCLYFACFVGLFMLLGFAAVILRVIYAKI